MDLSFKRMKENRAIAKVDDLERREDIRGLLKMLSDPHDIVVLKSIRTLTHITLKKGTDWIAGSGGCGTLVHLLDSRNPHIRKYSLVILSATAKEQGPALIIKAGGLQRIISRLSDGENDVVLFALDLLNNIANGGSADLVVYSDVLPALGKVMLRADPSLYESGLNLVVTLTANNYSAELASKGIVRVLYMKLDSFPPEGRMRTEVILEGIMGPLGYSDLNVFRQQYIHLEEEASHSIPEYNDPAMIQSHMNEKYGASGPDQQKFTGEEITAENGTFEVEDRDEEYVLYHEDIKFFPFNILSERLKDMRRLMDEGVITDLEFQRLKLEVLNEVNRTISLECINCYKALEVPVDASEEVINKAYRRAAVKYHPDKVNTMGPKLKVVALEEMTKLNYARDILLDPVRRSAHDRNLIGSSN